MKHFRVMTVISGKTYYCTDQYAETREGAIAAHNQEHRKRFAPEPVLESCVELRESETQEEITGVPA